jgi:HK97 family phage portal protein
MDHNQLNLPVASPNNHPSANKLLEQLRSTAWACASINSAICATFTPTLYVRTAKHQPTPKCETRTIQPRALKSLRDRLEIKSDIELKEVANHPINKLLADPNKYHTSYDLWELTTLYQETVGSCFWLLDFNALGRPIAIWPLPSQWVFIWPSPDGTFFYQFRGEQYDEHQIIHFRYPDPSNPYYYGLSPLRAAQNEAKLSTTYAELKLARFENRAAPDVVISPKEPIGLEERNRLEASWDAKFRRRGNGKAYVSESEITVDLLNGQMGDLALLAEKGKNAEDICNAFHVPLSMLSTNTNLANLQASEAQHARIAINPRIRRRDEKLNDQLIPYFDPSKRLFLCSPDADPGNGEDWRTIQSAAQYGWQTINEIRATQDLPPVTWGDKPCTQPIPGPSASP